MTTEAAIAAVAKLAAADPDANIEAGLRSLLKHRSNFVIGKAVRLAEERRITSATPELIESFAYFMADCVKRDPGCSAKLAIVNCLMAFNEPVWDVYLAGVQHVQKEPAFGPPIDTAGTLRGLCGRSLIAMGHHDAFRWHAVLLADREPVTRALAVETLGGVPDERAELLLRCKIAREPDPNPPEFRIHGREPEPNIEMDAFDGLMRIAPEESFDFVVWYLKTDDPNCVRGAALALGQTHEMTAFEALRERWASALRDADPEICSGLALGLALLRSDESFDFLLEALKSAPLPVASALIKGLALYREAPARAAAVQHIVDQRRNRELAQIYRKHFVDAAAE
jgi:hypothetical protein